MQNFHAGMKLGKLAPLHKPGVLRLARYLPSLQIKIPDMLDNTGKITTLGMMLNNELGNCTIAGICHGIQVWTSLASSTITIPDALIKSTYFGVTGGKDEGCVEEDVLDLMKTTGIGGHTIVDYAAIEKGNHYLRKLAIHLFGFAYKGVALPNSAQSQDIWTVTHGRDAMPGSWGGHCIIDAQYDQNFYTSITWGDRKKQTIGWDDKYCDEAYALLSKDWISVGKQVAPNGLEWNMLEDDLHKV